MNYAIVRFTAEEDSPGVISTNWINKDKNSCLFPNVQSEYQKNKLIISRRSPEENWISCPIKILKEFGKRSMILVSNK